MQTILKKTERLVQNTSLFLKGLAALFLIAMVIMTCIDVVGRYVFGNPLTGTVEIVKISMAAIVFFSLPWLFLKNDHIVVDLFPEPKAQIPFKLLVIARLLISVLVTWVLGRRIWAYAERTIEDGDVTEFLRIPQWPVVTVIAAMIFVVVAIAIFRVVTTLFLSVAPPNEITK